MSHTHTHTHHFPSGKMRAVVWLMWSLGGGCVFVLSYVKESSKVCICTCVCAQLLCTDLRKRAFTFLSSFGREKKNADQRRKVDIAC